MDPPEGQVSVSDISLERSWEVMWERQMVGMTRELSRVGEEVPHVLGQKRKGNERKYS